VFAEGYTEPAIKQDGTTHGNADCCGGSLIVNPMSRIIAGPMGPEERILYADCDLELACNED
jgi:predicted amidohydrolase